MFARLWTEVGGIWRYVDTTFGSASVTATLTYPPNGGVNIDQTQPATWTTIASAQEYELFIGSTRGANDVTDSGQTLSATFAMTRLPVGPTLYARLWTETAGVWRYRDSSFTAAPSGPQFVFPTDGEVAVDATQPFQWTPPPNAAAQELRVGTSPGGNDVFDSGVMVATSAVVNGLPTTGALYARALSSVNGVWHSTDIAFTLEAASPIASIVVPSDGQAAFRHGSAVLVVGGAVGERLSADNRQHAWRKRSPRQRCHLRDAAVRAGSSARTPLRPGAHKCSGTMAAQRFHVHGHGKHRVCGGANPERIVGDGCRSPDGFGRQRSVQLDRSGRRTGSDGELCRLRRGVAGRAGRHEHPASSQDPERRVEPGWHHCDCPHIGRDVRLG